MKDLVREYNFSDFTLTNYSDLLKCALDNRVFLFFTDCFKQRSILLRHDVEFSIPMALNMAQIEASLGIKATYFVQLHSQFYNTLEKESIMAIKEISGLGHQIGLHFDSHYWNIENEIQLDKYIAIDRQILEQYAGELVSAFSFHNNTPFTLSCRKDSYGGLLNVYSDYFRNKYSYTADSLGYWRFERLQNRLEENSDDSIQILIHEGMWHDEILPPRRRIFKIIDSNADKLKKLYDSFLSEIGEKNIDWDRVL